jgi:hypothetical protein
MDGIFELLDKQDIQSQIKSVVSPIGTMIYNELYIYIWFICIYNVFLFLIVVFNLYLLISGRREYFALHSEYKPI